jgi:outer membrane biosynthesis protein TonB
MALDAPPPESPVTNQGYIRPPGREITGLTRANRSATEIPAEPARPAPLFSNEGVVRQAEMGRRGRGFSVGGSGSPDLDRHGEPRVRGGRRRRAIGVVLLAGLLGVAVLGVASTAALSALPNNAAPSRSLGASSDIALGVVNIQAKGSSTADATATATGVAIGDDPLSTAAADPAAEPRVTGAPRPATPMPAPIPQPTPQPPVPPTLPAPIPTLTPLPTPTSMPTPTLQPTPTPAANFVAFEPAGSTRGGYTAIYSVPQGTNVTFIIDGLGGARCALSSNPHMPGAPAAQTIPGFAPQVNSITVATWGASWRLGAYAVTATCTRTGQPTATATQIVHIN